MHFETNTFLSEKSIEIADPTPLGRIIVAQECCKRLDQSADVLGNVLAGPRPKTIAEYASKLDAASRVMVQLQSSTTVAVRAITEAAAAARQSASMSMSFHCSHDDMVDMVDTLLPNKELMQILSIALRAPDPFDMWGPEVFARNLETAVDGIERVHKMMRTCFEAQAARIEGASA